MVVARRSVVVIAVLLLCFGLSACGLLSVPQQEIQTFVDAWAEVKKTHDTFLAQYTKDQSEAPSADSSQPAPSTPRYPGPLPDLVAPGVRPESPDIAVRAAAVEVVDRYNTILLAIRDNRPLTQTRQLMNRLGDLLLTGLRMGAGAIGLPAGVLKPIVNTMKTARTRAEIIRALRAAKISQMAYGLLLKSNGDPDSQAAKDLAALPVQEIACPAAEELTCVSLIAFTLDLMRADANAFYAARDAAVLKERASLTSHLAKLLRGLKGYLQQRQLPGADSDLAQARVEAQAAFNTILKAFGQNAVTFPIDPSGAPYDQGSEDFVTNALVAARALDEKDAALGAGLTAYRQAILQYRDTLLPQTAGYFAEIEVALARAPDLLGVSAVDGDTIIPLAESLIDGSANIRAVLRGAIGLN